MLHHHDDTLIAGDRSSGSQIFQLPIARRVAAYGQWTSTTGSSGFKSDIKAEVNAGKPAKQAVAIAYSVARKGGKKGSVTAARTVDGEQTS